MKLGLSDGQRPQVNVNPFDPTLPSSDHRSRPFCFTLPFFLPQASPFFPSQSAADNRVTYKALSAVWSASHQREEVSKRRQRGLSVSQVPSEEIDTDSYSPQDPNADLQLHQTL